MALIPNGTRVIVQRKTAETETAGGILIPGAEEKKLNEGVIVAVGPDCKEYMVNGEYVILTHSQVRKSIMMVKTTQY